MRHQQLASKNSPNMEGQKSTRQECRKAGGLSAEIPNCTTPPYSSLQGDAIYYHATTSAGTKSPQSGTGVGPAHSRPCREITRVSRITLPSKTYIAHGVRFDAAWHA